MRILLLISLRNLFRQKRRNLLLGAAIAIGMAVLVIANSFSHGISDVLFNRILTYMSGHVSLTFAQGGNLLRPVFNDGGRMLAAVHQAIPGSASVEEGVGVFARAIGNGRTDNVILVGMNTRQQGTRKQMDAMRADFFMVEGRYEDILRQDLENPVLVASTKAAYLNVKVNDYLRVRFQDIHGRSQAVRLTVAGIFKPANIFMAAPVFLDRDKLKLLDGYGPGDVAAIQINLSDPKRDAVKAADAVHALLAPPLAIASGRLEKGGASVSALALGFRVDTASLVGVVKALSLRLPQGQVLLGKNEVLAGRALADSLALRIGDRCRLRYRTKLDTSAAAEAIAEFTVTAILPATPGFPANALLVNDKEFYGFYYEHWPRAPAAGLAARIGESAPALLPFLSREWILLDRTASTEALQKKHRDLTRLKSKAVTVDVQTMYENASMIIKLEFALNLITLVAVLILFLIIQVGVVNTLRMTIRERTREIGTLRAIGMRQGDVRNIFLLETLFLSLFAGAAGLCLAMLSMWGFSQIAFRTEGNAMGMLLVDGHLHFLPSPAGTALYFLLILAIAAATAWFPSRRAAAIPAAEALRHYE